VDGLRAEGWTIHAMQEIFPSSDRSRSRRFADENWIPNVTERGWAILSKDGFRYHHERQAIADCGAKVFMIPNAQLRSEYMVERFVASREAIWAHCGEDGPFLYAIRPTTIDPLTLPDS
jgi:PIN like domain